MPQDHGLVSALGTLSKHYVRTIIIIIVVVVVKVIIIDTLIQYCEKVMQTKCANFVLCFPDFSHETSR